MKFKKALAIGIDEESLDKEYWQQINDLVETIVKVPKDDSKIKTEIVDSDCLLTGFQVDVDRQLIESAKNLKYIGVSATAFGTIDIKAAAEKGIPVCNLAGYSSESVAEFTVAVLLSKIRKLEVGRAMADKGEYWDAGFSSVGLKGSKFGVVGLGSIGNRVAELAASFGADVCYWSRSEKQAGFNRVELNELLSSCDYISLNVAQTDETNNLINADNLKLVKPGAVMVSTVPPEVVNTDALAEKLKQDDFTYITDHPDEMSKEDIAKIKDLPNCIIYPAIAYTTEEARQAKQNMLISNMKASLAGKPENKVN